MFELTYSSEAVWKEMGGGSTIPPPPPDMPVERIALLNWEEHCIECAVPECYEGCPLYRRRRDGRCARFAYGIYPNRAVAGPHGFGADIHFRRWAKLEARWPSAPALRSPDEWRRRAAAIAWAETLTEAVAASLDWCGVGRQVRGKAKALRRLWAARVAEAPDDQRLPDGFYVKFYASGEGTGNLHLEVAGEVPLFGRRLAIEPGWNEHYLPIADLAHLMGGDPKLARLWVDGDEERRLVFTWLDLVAGAATDRPAAAQPAAKVKCVAWDLDNTLWEGVLAEGGGTDARLFPGRRELLAALDERGILQTVASKNEYEVAWERLEELGLAEYFLYPAIHWGPKSRSLEQVAQALNIGVDSFAFVDDSDFERGEVSQALPQVRVYDPAELDTLLDRAEFSVPVTEEGRTRREKYRSEAQRKRILAEWTGDYEAFLRSCDLVMQIGSPGDEHWERCLELVNRSNQFNLSGHRYTLPELRAAAEGDGDEPIAWKVRDQHGDYGLVGFAILRTCGADIDVAEFVMSCRVAQKRVEDTFLLTQARRAAERGGRLRIRARVTNRNAPLRASLERIGFVTEERATESEYLALPTDAEIRVPDVMRVETL